MAGQIPVTMSNKLLKQMSSAFIGLPRPQTGFQTTHHVTAPTKLTSVDPVARIEKQIEAVDAALALISKRRQIVEQAMARCEAAAGVQVAAAQPKPAKKKGQVRSGAEDRPCGWSERLTWSDEEVEAWDGSDEPLPEPLEGEDAGAATRLPAGCCTNPRRRCDRHQG
jgi:COMPASS component SPP1